MRRSAQGWRTVGAPRMIQLLPVITNSLQARDSAARRRICGIHDAVPLRTQQRDGDKRRAEAHTFAIPFDRSHCISRVPEVNELAGVVKAFAAETVRSCDGGLGLAGVELFYLHGTPCSAVSVPADQYLCV